MAKPKFDINALDIKEWIDTELFGSFDVVASPTIAGTRWYPLEVAPGRQLQESTRAATYADSNLPRPASMGLLQDWAMHIVAWRATVDAPSQILTSNVLAAFLAEASARLGYNGLAYRHTTLADLIRTDRLAATVRKEIEEALMPGEAQPPVITQLLDRLVLPGTLMLPLRLVHHIGFEVMVEAPRVDTLALRSELAKTDARVTVRVYLRGLLKRPIV